MPPRDRTKRRTLPTQERARASVEAIVAAAEMLLRDGGFARMTTNRIAARAGVNVALVYRYFSGKEAIVGTVIDRVANETYEAVRAALAENASKPIATAVRAMLKALIHPPGVHPSLHRELFEHLDMTKRRYVLTTTRTRLGELFAQFLAERHQELRPLAGPEALVFVMQHAVEGATHGAAFYRPQDLSAERALDALTDVVTRALLPASTAGVVG